jgi:hypothetical protein
MVLVVLVSSDDAFSGVGCCLVLAVLVIGVSVAIVCGRQFFPQVVFCLFGARLWLLLHCRPRGGVFVVVWSDRWSSI